MNNSTLREGGMEGGREKGERECVCVTTLTLLRLGWDESVKQVSIILCPGELSCINPLPLYTYRSFM